MYLMRKRKNDEAAYWRKANAIHHWFVENVQRGIDDCKEYEVTKAQLEELLSTVNKVLDDFSLAEELLPTTTGFFFGGTEYDEAYLEDLKITKESLDRILKEHCDTDTYYYQSSW
jgi:hypothetical protein